MRVLSTLTYILILSLSTTTMLLAQGPWVPASVPEGDYVPNQLIIRFDTPDDAGIIKQEFTAIHGVQVQVYQIDAAGHYFLIDVLSGIDSPSCVRDSSAPNPLPCTMCDVLGNPGGGGPMDRGDNIWPNYYGTPGTITGNSNVPEYSKTDVFGNGDFNPLAGEPESPPGTGTTEICYEDYTLPFANSQVLKNIKIAILDSGIAPDNYNDFFNYSVNGADNSMVRWASVPPIIAGTNLEQINVDPNGHGTAVAFLLAHDFVNRGASQKVKLYSYRILDETATGTLADVFRSLDYAINDNMDMINLSFGFKEIDCVKNNGEGYITHAKYAFDDLFSRARDEKILVFTSAGNDKKDLGIEPQWPAVFSDADNVFTIGADECTPGVKWDDSNYNASYVDLMAPGYNIVVPFAGDIANNPGNYILASGTSFATPLAAGVAATYLSAGNYNIALCALENETNSSEETATPSDARLGSIFDIEVVSCLSDPGGNTHCSNCVEEARNSSSAYPNPFEEQLLAAVSVDDGQIASLRLLDISGRPVVKYNSRTEQVTLNTTGLAPGVYFLQITDANGSRIERVIKR